jgi:hypothetical protein
MPETLRKTHRLIAGLLSEKQTIATGLLIGLIAWTVTRLVDGILGTGTIEYQTVYSPAKLDNGMDGTKIEVTLTNLSRDTSVSGLKVVINDPTGKTTFSNNPRDKNCAFEPPAWADDATCEAYKDGMTFETPMLVPGTFVRLAIKYMQSGALHQPVVRIRPQPDSKLQLVQPGVQTFVARHEVMLLLALLGATLVLFGISVTANIREKPTEKRQEKK